MFEELKAFFYKHEKWFNSHGVFGHSSVVDGTYQIIMSLDKKIETLQEQINELKKGKL